MEHCYYETVYSDSFINSNFSLKESKIINKSKIKNRYTERKLSKFYFWKVILSLDKDNVKESYASNSSERLKAEAIKKVPRKVIKW